MTSSVERRTMQAESTVHVASLKCSWVVYLVSHLRNRTCGSDWERMSTREKKKRYGKDKVSKQ